METQSRKRRSTVIVSVSFESCTISSGVSSQCRPATGRGTFRGETLADDLSFYIEVDLFGEEEVYPGARVRSLRSRFQPCQARVNGHTGVVDGSIRDTHL